MTIREIVADWLRTHNCDGLCGGECRCSVDNLMPCECPAFLGAHECVAAVRGLVPEEYKGEYEDWFVPAKLAEMEKNDGRHG